MAEDKTTETAPEEKKAPARRRSSSSIKPGDKVRARVRIAFVDGRVGEESVVEATDHLLALAERGYVTLERVE